MTLPAESVAPPASSYAGPGAAAPEQTRARYPDAEGFVARDGVRVFYERYGDGGHTILFLPAWSIVHSRIWKAQIPYFARHFRVVTFDGRGNGRSDRPEEVAAYEEAEFAADAIAVMDATDTDSAVIVALSRGAQPALMLAGDHPERVRGVVFLGARVPLVSPSSGAAAAMAQFKHPRESYEGWEKFNSHYWRHDFEGWLEFFFSQAFVEPHSTKQIEDSVGSTGSYGG